MKSKNESEYEERLKHTKELYELYKQLSPWDQRMFLWHVHWIILRNKIRDFPINWIKTQLRIVEEIKIHGMPWFMKMRLEKWFNMSPWPQSKPIYVHRIKFWIDRFEEDDNFEIHLTHRGRWIAYAWVETKGEEWTLYGIHVSVDKNRNMGLGRYLLSQVKEHAQTRGAKVIREIIEKDCEWPKKEKEFANILAWYKHRGFLLSEDEENFILTLYINN